MNNCVFTGYLLNDPVLSYQGTDKFCECRMVVYEYVTKHDEKKRYSTFLSFQVWDSGAGAFVKLGKRGMKVTILASAINPRRADPPDQIVFRVEKFDFLGFNSKETE